ncbi:hypothetical protein FACS1894187_23140 [Synergistales bacterium]|nr:hypothetical protein FACS1894187_23140 [Synergistales bacterium]
MNEAEIKEYVDEGKALERIRNNAKLFKTLLKSFVGTTPDQIAQLKKEIEAGDKAAAAKSVHTIKGVAANLSMPKLYELSPQFETLLKGDGDTAEMMTNYGAVYDKTIEVVKILMEKYA